MDRKTYEANLIEMFAQLDSAEFLEAEEQGIDFKEFFIQIHSQVVLKALNLLIKESPNPKKEGPEITAWFLNNLFEELKNMKNTGDIEYVTEEDMVNEKTHSKIRDILHGDD